MLPAGVQHEEEGGEEEEEEEEEEVRPPVDTKPAKRGPKVKPAGAAAGQPSAAGQSSPWTRTPCSETGAFYYAQMDGRMQWEVPVDLERRTKKGRPSRPPPPRPFRATNPLQRRPTCLLSSVAPPAAEAAVAEAAAAAEATAALWAMDLMAQLQRNGATVNLAVVQRGA